MTDEKIIERIEALYRLAESTSFESERDNAIARAEEIIRRYNIDRVRLGKASASSIDRLTIDFIYPTFQRMQAIVASSLSDFLFVRISSTVGKRRKYLQLNIYGERTNIEAFLVVYRRVLLHMFTSAVDAAAKSGVVRGQGRSFYTSFYAGYVQRLDTIIARKLSEREIAVQSDSTVPGIEGITDSMALTIIDDQLEAFYKSLKLRQHSTPFKVTDGNSFRAGADMATAAPIDEQLRGA